MADDNSSAPVEQGAGERPAIRRPWLLLGGALGHRVCRHRVAVRPAAGRGLRPGSVADRSDLGGRGVRPGHPSQHGRADFDRVDPVLQRDGGRPGLAGLAGSERTHGLRAGAADGGDLPPRPPGADEPDRLRHCARDERSGAGLPTLPAALQRPAQGRTHARQAAPAGPGVVGRGAGGAAAARLRGAVRRGRRGLRGLPAGDVRLGSGLSPTARAPDLEPDPELAGARVGAAGLHRQDDPAGAGGLR